MQYYDFEVLYVKGKDLPHVDALSRCYEEINVLNEELSLEEKEKIIRQKHLDLVHRGEKVVTEELQKIYNWEEIKRLVHKTIKNCKVCKKYNSISRGRNKVLTAYEPGEKVAFDILGPINNRYIINAVDYFTRKGWSEVLTSKGGNEVLNFLRRVYIENKFKVLISDQAKENMTKQLKLWAVDNDIKIHLTSPYNHQSNGMVERFNRTILGGLRKVEKGLSLRDNLRKVISVYNSVSHSAIQMSPNEACLKENWNKLKVLQHARVLKIAEKQKKCPRLKAFVVGDGVLIREEIDKRKMSPRFKKQGKIIEVLGNDTYLVRSQHKNVKRHGSQLKLNAIGEKDGERNVE